MEKHWYNDFLIRLREKDEIAYNKEMRKHEKINKLNPPKLKFEDFRLKYLEKTKLSFTFEEKLRLCVLTIEDDKQIKTAQNNIVCWKFLGEDNSPYFTGTHSVMTPYIVVRRNVKYLLKYEMGKYTRVIILIKAR